MKSPQPTHAWSLGAGKILVFDGIFGKKAAASISRAALRVKRSWKRAPQFEFHRILDPRAFQKDPLTSRLDAAARALISTYFPRSAGHRLSFPAINLIANDATSDVHIDTTRCPECVVCLMFGNPQWIPRWGGETVFYDGLQDARFAVAPRPGRLMLYHASLFHRAGVPTRVCPVSRVTVGVWYRCRHR